MTLIDLLKDMIRTEKRKQQAKKKKDLGRVEFYRPATIGRAPSASNREII